MSRRDLTAEALEFMGLPLHPMTPKELGEAVVDWVDSGRSATVAELNLHGLFLGHRDEVMRAFFDSATVVRVDGMGIVLLARCIGLDVRREHRFTHFDWLPIALDLARQHRWRVFFLGGAPGVAERGFRELGKGLDGPELGWEHGHFDKTPGSPQNLAVIDKVRAFDPHLLFVGMGMPLQERWLIENADRLPPCVVLTCGGTIDYFAGVQPRPPERLRRVGLEWAYRLVRNPRRFWRRYLVEPIAIAPVIVRELIRARGRGRSLRDREG